MKRLYISCLFLIGLSIILNGCRTELLVFDDIVTSGDYSLCADTNNPNSCHTEIALRYDSPLSCAYLQKTDQKSGEDCYLRYIDLIVDTMTQRKIVDDERQQYKIYLDFPYDPIYSDISEDFCDSIIYRKKECLSQVISLRGNEELCMDLESPYRDLCISNVALMNVDATLCELISEPFSQYYCYSTIALLSDDVIQCTYIDEGYLAAECVRDVAAFQKNDSYCVMSAYLKDFKQEWVFDCFNRVAIAERNPNLCVDIVDPIIRGKCFSTVAVALNNATLCENTAFWNDCMIKMAFKNNNASFCERAEKTESCLEFLKKRGSFSTVEDMYNAFLESS
jgi:hypothetical protein